MKSRIFGVPILIIAFALTTGCGRNSETADTSEPPGENAATESPTVESAPDTAESIDLAERVQEEFAGLRASLDDAGAAARSQLEKAESILKEGQFNKAAESLEEVLTLPDITPAQKEAITDTITDLKSDFTDAAVVAVEKVVAQLSKVAPDSEEELNNALAFVKQKEYGSALKELQAAAGTIELSEEHKQLLADAVDRIRSLASEEVLNDLGDQAGKALNDLKSKFPFGGN